MAAREVFAGVSELDWPCRRVLAVSMSCRARRLFYRNTSVQSNRDFTFPHAMRLPWDIRTISYNSVTVPFHLECQPSATHDAAAVSI
jgi:hypothetical protein